MSVAAVIGLLVTIALAWASSIGTALMLYVRSNTRHGQELSGISTRLATIEERIAGVKEKCAQHDGESVRIWSRLDNHEHRLTKSESGQSRNSQQKETS